MDTEEVVPVITPPIEDDDDAGDDAITCNICFEPWSNTGSHRISSLKCGHFFGFACIEKWLNSTGGNDCPTCNEKATKRDIRHHYVAQLKAIDTADKDRALEQVEALKKELRKIELEQATLKVTNLLQSEEIEKLKSLIQKLQKGGTVMSKVTCDAIVAEAPGTYRLTHLKRLEILKPDPTNSDPNRCCRVMAYNETYGMLVVSQPSHFQALAPGYGIRRVHMLDKKLESFVYLHKDPIRDMSFNPVNQDQLLSVSQDKTIRYGIEISSEVDCRHSYFLKSRKKTIGFLTKQSLPNAQYLWSFVFEHLFPGATLGRVPWIPVNSRISRLLDPILKNL